MLKLASLKASSHLRNTHATFNGAHSEMGNVQTPGLRWGTSCAGECWHCWAASQPALLLRGSLCPECSGHATAATSLCLSTGWHSPSNSAIQASQVSVRLLYACASCALYKKMYFLGTAAGSFRLLLVPWWCCSDPASGHQPHRRGFSHIRLKVLFAISSKNSWPAQLCPLFSVQIFTFFLLNELHCLKQHQENPEVEPQSCGPVLCCMLLLFASASVKLTEYPWIVLNWFQWKAAGVFAPVLFL